MAVPQAVAEPARARSLTSPTPHGQHHTKTLGDLPGWCLARVPSWDWRHLETCGQQQPQLEMLMLPPQWQKVENHHWERKGKGGAGKGLLQ